MLTNRIMSLDVESNGLWGEPISIGFTIENNGRVIFKAEACFIDESKQYNEWVQKNVIEPMKQNKNILHLSSYEELLLWFADHYNRYKTEYTVLYHMGHIVEANLFKELVSGGYIGEWDAPYTPIEVSALLAACGYDMDSVDKLAELGLIEKPSESQKHQALYDAEVAGRAYWFLKKKLLGENTEKTLGERIYDELIKLEKLYPHLNVCEEMKEIIKSFKDEVNRVPINFYDIYDIPQGQPYSGRHSTYYRIYIENTMTNEEIYQVIEKAIKNRQPYQVETIITDIDESRRLNNYYQNYLKEKELKEQKEGLKEKEVKKKENISSLKRKRNRGKERNLVTDFLSLLGLND